MPSGKTSSSFNYSSSSRIIYAISYGYRIPTCKWSSTMSTCQPASLTKHLLLIHHPLPRQCLPPGAEQDESILRLKQISFSNSSSDDNYSREKGASSTGTTGTTLWLGGQLMSCYIAETLPAGSTLNNGQRQHKRVLELGGGIGFLS
jgi:hypothetical protein